MPKRHKKRNYRTITFKVYFDEDTDILEWWDGIEAGERSDTIRDLIRDCLGVPARHRKRIQIPGLHDMHRDILWIHDALNEMPSYIERVIDHVSALQPTGTDSAYVHHHREQTMPVPDEQALTDDETTRRDRHMRKATW